MKKYSLQVHSSQHSKEDCIFNPDVFGGDIVEGSYVRLYDPERSGAQKLVLRVPALNQVVGGRLEVSLSINIADAFSLKSFSRVVVEVVDVNDVELDFVEVTFKKQYLQRGNMWRYKRSLTGLAVHVPQIVTIDGVSAQMLELTAKGSHVHSGVITANTNIIFRSRSARIFWLIQMSSEMWAFDQNGDLYFEKVLSKFVSPVLDKWKALSVTHSLTIVFFTRSVIIDSEDLSVANSGIKQNGKHTRLFDNSQLSNSLQFVSEGVYYQDFYKVVAERVVDMDKMAVLQILKKEFLDFPSCVGWKFATNNACDHVADSRLQGARRKAPEARPNSTGDGTARVPSDAANGNFLEAVNTTLNILEKHYMDRDLQRTGGGIVIVSAGTGIFKVEPVLAQISKQRMMDTGYGIDFISVSSPPLHSVPLFMVMPKASTDSDSSAVGGFFEVPHWMNTSFVDCIPNESKSRVKKDPHDVIGRGGMEITRGSSKLNVPKHKWTGIYEYEEAILDAADITSEFNSLAVSRASRANKMEGISNEAKSRYDGSSEKWAGLFRPLPFAEVLECQAKVINDNRAGFIDFLMKNNRIMNESEQPRPWSPVHAQQKSVDQRVVMLKSDVSSAMRQNYSSAYLHVVSLPGPLVNLLMDSNSELYSTSNKAEKCHNPHGYASTEQSQQAVKDSKLPIPEWGAVKMNENLLPYCDLKSLCDGQLLTEKSNSGEQDINFPIGTAKFNGYANELANLLPRPHLFEVSKPVLIGHDTVKHHHRHKPRGSTPIEEPGSGSYNKYFQAAGEYISVGSVDKSETYLSAHQRDTSNVSLDSMTNVFMESHGTEQNITGATYLTGSKLAYRGSFYGSNTSLLSLNSMNTGHVSARSNRKTRRLSSSLFEDISSHILCFKPSDSLGSFKSKDSGEGCALENIMKQMALFDEKTMITNVFSRRIGSKAELLRYSSQEIDNGMKHVESGSVLKRLDAAPVDHIIHSVSDMGGFTRLSKRFSEPLGQLHSHQKPQSSNHGDGASSSTDKVVLVGMSPRISRRIDLAPSSSIVSSSGSKKNNNTQRCDDILFKSETPKSSLDEDRFSSAIEKSGRNSNSDIIVAVSTLPKPIKVTKPILIRSSSHVGESAASNHPKLSSTDEVDETAHSSFTRHGSSHQDVLEHRHRLQSHDTDANGSGSYKNGSNLNRKASAPRGQQSAVVSDLAFLVPGDLTGDSGSDSNDDDGIDSLSSSFESVANDAQETPPLGTELTNSSPAKLSGCSTSSTAGRCDPAVKLSVSPGNKNKNRYSIGNSAAAMLESDAMVRLGIRSVLGSTETAAQTPPDDSVVLVAKNGSNRHSASIGINSGSSSAAYVSKTESAIGEFNERYRKKYMTNPFREQEGKKFMKARTHNRRRWSHVFPDGNKNENWQVQHALNMKSLCQPAILPMTTDYVPPVRDLEGTRHPNAHFAYEKTSSYSSSHYSLILDPTVCAYSSPVHLLKEMIGQRLTQEFQLITGTDVSPYHVLIPGYEHTANLPTKSIKSSVGADSIKFSRLDKASSFQNSDENDGESFFHVLSMGHRIHFLAYIPSKREVKVSRYISTGVQTAANYEYELWVPQLQRFQRITQTFRQFPEPEYNWNVLDEILLGNLDVLSDTVRPKRLRYGIIPDIFKSEEEVDIYFANFKEFLQFFQKYCADGNEIKVERDRDASLQLKKGMSSTRNLNTATSMVKLWMTAPPHHNPKWLYVKHDMVFNPIKVFHLELHWIICDSWSIEDFTNAIFRRGTKLGMKLVQIPEYFVESNLQVHPFRAQPYIPVTLPSSELDLQPGLEERMKQVSLKARSLQVEKEVLIDHPAIWIRDDDRKTDWNNYGQFDQDTESLLSSPKPIVPSIGGVEVNAVPASGAVDLSIDASTHGGVDGYSQVGTARFGPAPRRTLKRALDRQYIHRSGLACVRVAPTGGFVWLLNSSARVTDTTMNADERREFATQILADFQNSCWGSLLRLLNSQTTSNSSFMESIQRASSSNIIGKDLECTSMPTVCETKPEEIK